MSTTLDDIANMISEQNGTILTMQKQQQATHTLLLDVAERVTRLEQRMIDIEQRMIDVEKRLSKVEQRMIDVEQRLIEVEHRVYSLEQRMSQLESQMAGLENDIKELYDLATAARREMLDRHQYNESLKQRIIKLEQFAIKAGAKLKLRFKA